MLRGLGRPGRAGERSWKAATLTQNSAARTQPSTRRKPRCQKQNVHVKALAELAGLLPVILPVECP